MRDRGRLILLITFVLCTAVSPCRSALADGEIEDIEHVPTPTRLADLLPSGGIHAVGINFWLIFSEPDEGGSKRDSLYMNWCIEPRVGLLYIEHIYGSDRGGMHGTGFHYRKRFKYTPDGVFVSYLADLQLGGGERQDITGKIVGDQLVLKTIHRPRWLVIKPTTTERAIPLSTFDKAVPVEWMPLIIAYHIRTGSLGYDVTTLELATGDVGHTRVEDLGTERYPHEGELHTAHFLGIEIDVEGRGSRRTEAMKLLTATDGNYFQFIYQGDRTRVRRSTIDEVCDVFKVKKARPGVLDGFNPVSRQYASPR